MRCVTALRFAAHHCSQHRYLNPTWNSKDEQKKSIGRGSRNTLVCVRGCLVSSLQIPLYNRFSNEASVISLCACESSENETFCCSKFVAWNLQLLLTRTFSGISLHKKKQTNKQKNGTTNEWLTPGVKNKKRWHNMSEHLLYSVYMP